VLKVPKAWKRRRSRSNDGQLWWVDLINLMGFRASIFARWQTWRNAKHIPRTRGPLSGSVWTAPWRQMKVGSFRKCQDILEIETCKVWKVVEFDRWTKMFRDLWGILLEDAIRRAPCVKHPRPTMLAHRGLNANTGRHQHSHHHNDGQVWARGWRCWPCLPRQQFQWQLSSVLRCSLADWPRLQGIFSPTWCHFGGRNTPQLETTGSQPFSAHISTHQHTKLPKDTKRW
jgi:hypothetical protein